MKKEIVVFVGGGTGALMRYWLSGVVYRFVRADFPYGTMAVNVLGCFVIGFLMEFFAERFVVEPLWRLFLTIGILGGFTTFSTFSFETVSLLREGSVLNGTANILMTLTLCLAATWIGTVIGKLL